MKKLLLCHFPKAFYLWAALSIFACQSNTNQSNQNNSQALEPTVTRSPFGTLPDGRTVEIFTLTNKNGVEARITNLGGIIVSVRTPDRNGQLADVVLGYDSLAPYLEEHPYFGAIVGRYGNRIANGKFSIDGESYTLATNNGPNHLHGGLLGFDKYIWDVETRTGEGEVSLILSHFSPDGDEGYPGNLNVQVTYTLTDDNDLRMYYAARTDKTTVVNLTNHAYFNLTGDPSQSILDHEMTIMADAYLPVNEDLIPTGALEDLSGGNFDFQMPKAIGTHIKAEDEQLNIAGGYDHTWVLRKDEENKKPQLAASVYEPKSGRVLEVLTTEPGIQFYTGNFLDGNYTGKGGKVYQDHAGFCLETQHFPDSPNQPNFPSTLLKPGETYRTTTIYRFSVR